MQTMGNETLAGGTGVSRVTLRGGRAAIRRRAPLAGLRCRDGEDFFFMRLFSLRAEVGGMLGANLPGQDVNVPKSGLLDVTGIYFP